MSMLETICAARDFPDPFSLEDMGWDGTGIPVFYTDGSCPFPKLPRGHVAAFSIVWDSLSSDDDRRGVARELRGSGALPSTLFPVQAALAVGMQTNNRAELCAILQVIRSQNSAIIFSDSQYAIDLFHSVAAMPNPFVHQGKQNFDLIVLLCDLSNSKDLSAFAMVKIKSHREDLEVQDDLDLYHTYGNRYADRIAFHGTQPHRSAFHSAAHEVAIWYQQQLATLKDLRSLLTRMHMRRLDAWQSEDSGTQRTATYSPKFSLESIVTWDPPFAVPCFANMNIPDSVLRAFAPGASVLLSIVQWCSTVCWPSDVDDFTCGISTFELVLNYLGTVAHPLVRVCNRG